MKKLLNFEQLFEYRTGPKVKIKWTENDTIIALYYEKFGLEHLGYTESNIKKFVNEYIGSTEDSLKMQALNIRYILTHEGEKPSGLKNFTKKQVAVVEKYSNLKEFELRKIVKDILDNTTDDEKLENLIRASELRKKEKKDKLINKEKQFTPFGLKEFGKTYSSEEIPVKVGDSLYHKKFGDGIVTSIDGNLLEINFDGISKLIVYNPNHYI